MQMSGEYRIPAPRKAVWAALNDPEILKQCMEHGRKAHGMEEIPQDLEKKIRSLIREEAA